MPADPSRCCSHALTLLRCYINSAHLRASSPDAPIVSTGVRLGRAVSLRHAGCGTGKQKPKTTCGSVTPIPGEVRPIHDPGHFAIDPDRLS